MGSPNLLREKVQEELKAAGICFFFAPLIWLAGSTIIACTAILCGVAVIAIPPLLRKLEKSPPSLGRAEPLRWYQSILLAPVVLLVLYALYLGLTGAVDTYQCYKAGGLYNWTEGKCG